ncbi:MAG: uridylate kinase [Methyloligella sp. ZOD6]
MSGQALQKSSSRQPDRIPDHLRPVIVKLGGSIVRSGDLESWLDAIAAAPCPIVVVPGGGALADEVRATQSALGFGDPAAHRMALLAMDQLAWAVAGLRPDFTVGDSETALMESLDQNRVAVWAPFAHVANRPEIAPSWAITSDSLALWLAGRLAAKRCYIVKSIERRQGVTGAAALASEGIVDEAFPEMFRQAGVPTFLLGKGDQEGFASSLAAEEPCGAAID